MGMKQTQEQTSYAGRQTNAGRQGLAALQGYLQEVQGMQQQPLQITGEDRALVADAQAASGEQARMQMEDSMQSILRQLEDTAIGRGIQGSSLEAVNNALVGQDFQRQLSQLALQQQGQASQQLLNMPFQRSAAINDQNLARFQMLTGAANPLVGYDQFMRQLTATQKGESSQPMGPMLAQLGGRAAAAYFTQGASEGAGGGGTG
jgi:hypothetical protein